MGSSQPHASCDTVPLKVLNVLALLFAEALPHEQGPEAIAAERLEFYQDFLEPEFSEPANSEPRCPEPGDSEASFFAQSIFSEPTNSEPANSGPTNCEPNKNMSQQIRNLASLSQIPTLSRATLNSKLL
jgi:hypothetical protein